MIDLEVSEYGQFLAGLQSLPVDEYEAARLWREKLEQTRGHVDTPVRGACRALRILIYKKMESFFLSICSYRVGDGCLCTFIFMAYNDSLEAEWTLRYLGSKHL